MKIRLALITLAVASLAGPAQGGIFVPPPPGDSRPTWSPDASAIVFSSTREPDTLRVVRPDGGGERPIPVLAGRFDQPTQFSFSPDWYWIAVVIDSRLVVMRPDGSQRHDLGSAAFDCEPSWSPDGRQLVFQDSGVVYVTNADGSGGRLRVAGGWFPQWSPRGDDIAFVEPPYQNASLLLVLPNDVGTARILPAGQIQPGTIRWSPDGSRIAFLVPAVRRHPVRLGVVSVPGGEARTYNVAASQFAWAPDGRRIAVVWGNKLNIVDTATGATRLVMADGYDPAWSPDGHEIAFAAAGQCGRSGIYSALVDAAPVLERLTNDCHIYGTPGPDDLRGTELTDVIIGLAGNDRLTAVGGDVLEGDDGNDVLVGGYGSDTLAGGRGDDLLSGGAAADRITGGLGRDVIQAGGGADKVFARDGTRDLVSCGTNTLTTTGAEADIAYVDRVDVVAKDCEYVFRPGVVPTPKGKTSLEITVRPNGNEPGAPVRVYTLRCRPSGGSLPRASSACMRLGKIQNPFGPLPKEMACTQIYGGPQEAVVIGVYAGRAVRTRFTRTDGCQIAHWNRVKFLFPL